MDIILVVFKFIGIAGVVYAALAFWGYATLWSLFYDLEESRSDDNPDYDL